MLRGKREEFEQHKVEWSAESFLFSLMCLVERNPTPAEETDRVDFGVELVVHKIRAYSSRSTHTSLLLLFLLFGLFDML